MIHASLYSGIGGFDKAAEMIGWTNAFHCENNPFCKKVLKYHFPNSVSYDDIKQTDFSLWRRKIDILTGGFPCQPFSVAGKQKGKEDDRYLWKEMLRAVEQTQPAWVVGENVTGIINLALDEVCFDLEAQGYAVQPFVIPACAINAPHRRDRVWIIAQNANRVRRDGSQRKSESEVWGLGKFSSGDNERIYREPNSTDSSDSRLEGLRQTGQNPIYETGAFANTTSERRLQSKSVNEAKFVSENGENEISSNAKRTGLQESKKSEQQIGLSNAKRTHSQFNWENFPTTEPTIRSGDDGVPAGLDFITFSKWRQESIKSYGNAIVPGVAYEIFKVIDTVMKEQIK